jgi:hypothetical protein
MIGFLLGRLRMFIGEFREGITNIACSVVAGISQGVAASVPEHMGVDREWHARAPTEPQNERVEALRRNRAAPLQMA